MVKIRLLAPLLVAAMVAAGCGSTDDAAPTTTRPGTTVIDPSDRTGEFTPGDVVAVDLPRTSPSVTASDVAAVVRSDTAFGLDLLGVVAADDNTMLSPYSIATALSMLYAGASGATAEEISQVLHLDVDDDTLFAVRNHIDVALATPAPAADQTDTRAPFTIRPANSAWGQGGYPFNEDYLTVLATHFGAGLRVVDYAGDPDGARAIINRWVEDSTEDRIKDLIPPDAVTVDTRLTLVNAIWFYANWAERFEPEATAEAPFMLLDGSEIQVPLMRTTLRTGYVETDSFEAVRLPYAGDAAMVVLLPSSGSPVELAASLEPEDLNLSWGDRSVDITLPSFEFEAELSLKRALQELGMTTAFEPPTSTSGADLTGITDVRELSVSDAFHKTFVAVDENGTEAAAATAIIAGATSAPQPATFTADRPFLFWIEHSSTGELLFLGQVTNPS